MTKMAEKGMFHVLFCNSGEVHSDEAGEKKDTVPGRADLSGFRVRHFCTDDVTGFFSGQIFRNYRL